MRRHLDRIRRAEVWLARTEVDHLDARAAKLVHRRPHRHRR
jgi:hypothetical protein